MTVATRTTTPIPQPPARMIVGNLPEMRRKPTAVESLIDLAREYGEIFQLDLPLGRLIVASGPELVAELCDESKWDKALGQGLLLIRKGIGDGLFTAYTHEPNWQKAHNILMPTFSHQAMKAYVPSMVDIAEQLMGAFEKAAAGDLEVDVPDEMTRLTLDTIGLCGFSVRFNSFQSNELHPFVQAMMDNLNGQQAIAARPQAITKLMIGEKRRMARAQDVMKQTVQDIIVERRQSGKEENDLLQFMLSGVDKKSGEGLPDTNIVSQCITFLVAGHETTSGLLSFAVHYLLKNPALLKRAHDEADRVFGPDRNAQPTFEQINSLHFIEQVLKESLRLWPTAPAFNRAPDQDRLLGGRYEIPAKQQVLVLIPALHRNASIWPDPERFDPDRFLPAHEASRPANVFLPFGTGARACIGRQFAMQEAKLVLGMLLHRFDLVDFAQYQLKVKQSLTIKPKDFKIKVKKRTPSGEKQAAAAAPAGAAHPPSRPRRRPAWPCRFSTAPTWEPARASPTSWPPRRAGAASRPTPRPSTRPCSTWPRRAPCWSSARPTTARRRTTRPSSAAGCTRPKTRSRGCATPSSAAATESGPIPTRRSPGGSMPTSRRGAPRASWRAARATLRATSTATSAAGRTASGRPWPRPSSWPLRRKPRPRPASRSRCSRTCTPTPSPRPSKPCPWWS